VQVSTCRNHETDAGFICPNSPTNVAAGIAIVAALRSGPQFFCPMISSLTRTALEAAMNADLLKAAERSALAQKQAHWDKIRAKLRQKEALELPCPLVRVFEA
jgi:hypothetical protein